MLFNTTLIVDSEASLSFSHNYATSGGGALGLVTSTAHNIMNTSGIEFYDNRASHGGAICFRYGTMI